MFLVTWTLHCEMRAGAYKEKCLLYDPSCKSKIQVQLYHKNQQVLQGISSRESDTSKKGGLTGKKKKKAIPWETC